MGRAEDIYNRIIAEGENAIDYFIETQASEELFIDFKQATKFGEGNVLNLKDRNNLEKAISGFGNSEGGIIVWGIECSKKKSDNLDVASSKKPIINICRFKSWIENAISGCTIPPHNGVQNHVIPLNQNDNGYLITYIPKRQNPPLQSVNYKSFYIRAGSSFVPAPYSVIASMFGRRPQPKLDIKFSIGTSSTIVDNSHYVHFQIVGKLLNSGIGIARDIYLNAKIQSYPGKMCSVSFNNEVKYWKRILDKSSENYTVISESAYWLPPNISIEVFIISLRLFPPFSASLTYNGTFGSENVPSKIFSRNFSTDLLDDLYNNLLDASDNESRKEILNKNLIGFLNNT